MYKVLFKRGEDFRGFKKKIPMPKNYPCVLIMCDDSYIYVYPKDFFPVCDIKEKLRRIEKLEALGVQNEEVDTLKKQILCNTAPFKPGDLIRGVRTLSCPVGIRLDKKCNPFHCDECPDKRITAETHLVVGFSFRSGWNENQCYYDMFTRKFTAHNLPSKLLTYIHSLIDDHFDLQSPEIIGEDKNYLSGIKLRRDQKLPMIHTVEEMEKYK